MSRIVLCILLAAAMLLTAACADVPADVSPSRTLTPMQPLATAEEEQISDKPALESAEPARTLTPMVPMTSAEAADVAFHEEAAKEHATLAPGELVIPTPAPAARTPHPNAPSELTISVLLPGDFVYGISPRWTSTVHDSSREHGMRTYEIGDSGTIVILYQDVSSVMTGDEDTDRSVLEQIILSESLLLGTMSITPVHQETSLPYAWISWFGSSRMVGSSGDSSQMAAFSDGQYLYTIAQISSSESDTVSAQWTELLASLRLGDSYILDLSNN